MNVVDSSGWLEYLSDGPNADFFSKAIEDIRHLVVPTISVLEVFKRVLQQRNQNDALQAVALMKQGELVDLSEAIAVSAAKIGHDLKLPLADSVILATARKYNAIVWTQDADFDGLEDVRFVAKR